MKRNNIKERAKLVPLRIKIKVQFMFLRFRAEHFIHKIKKLFK